MPGLRDEAAGRAAWRPVCHVTGERNWINDPTGPVRRDGRYHLFFQAHADAPFWGPPSWGHVSSADLVTWTRHPAALRPEPDAPDADGCWSGCTRFVDGRPAIYYTGVVGEGDDRVETVCRAWGSDDLLRWRRDPANPLVAGPPPGRERGYHRDPFLWRDRGGWHMLLGSGTGGGDPHGQVLRYDSADAGRWTYGGVFYEAPGELDGRALGELWECPQLVRGEGDAAALIVSCAQPGAERPALHSVAFTGTIRAGRFEGRLAGPLDHGDVFYAPVVLEEGPGDALLWGWLQERLDRDEQAALAFAGALSLPRRLTLRDGALRVVLADEVARLRGAALSVAPVPGGAAVVTPAPQMELAATLDAARGRAGWVLAAGADQASVVVDADRGRLEVTVTDRGRTRTLTAALEARPRHDLRVLVDGSVLEVFADEDRAATTRAYPRRPWETARLVAGDDARVEGVRAWTLAAHGRDRGEVGESR